MTQWIHKSFCLLYKSSHFLTVRCAYKSYSPRTLVGALEDSLEQGGGHPQPEAHGGSTAQGNVIRTYFLLEESYQDRHVGG
jgi:hypothetical protein